MAHLYAAYKCSYCCELPETAPLFHCPNRHQYCFECFKKLQRLYRGNIDGGSCCLICKYSGKFERSEVSTDFLKKLKKKPGIGRPCRYTTNVDFNNDNKLGTSKHYANDNCPYENTQVETNQGDGLFLKSIRTLHIISSTNFSKRPLTCLHNGCKKSVAVSSLVSHFKHDHGGVPSFRVEKKGDLNLQFFLSLIEYNKTLCLAMVTIFEHNMIDVVRSRSSQSVINVCNKLSAKVPLNTFWLMMSASPDSYKNHSFAVFWLFSNSEDHYYCTLELSATDDKMSISSFCSTIGVHEGRNIKDVVRSMNCLFVTHGTFLALIGDEDRINLRIVVH